MISPSAPTTQTPTVTNIAITSLDRVVISTSDQKTFNAGSITNAIANKNAPYQQLHDALIAFHASAVAAAKLSGSDAVTDALAPAHAFLASPFAKRALTPTDITAGAAAVADASLTWRQRSLSKAQKTADDASLALANLKAQQANSEGEIARNS